MNETADALAYPRGRPDYNAHILGAFRTIVRNSPTMGDSRLGRAIDSMPEAWGDLRGWAEDPRNLLRFADCVRRTFSAFWTTNALFWMPDAYESKRAERNDIALTMVDAAATLWADATATVEIYAPSFGWGEDAARMDAIHAAMMGILGDLEREAEGTMFYQPSPRPLSGVGYNAARRNLVP